MVLKTIEQIKEEVYGQADYIIRPDMQWIINEVATRYASQFQTNTDLVTAEICAMRERVAELEGCLKEIIPLAEDGYKRHRSNACHQDFLEDDKELLKKSKLLINKGK